MASKNQRFIDALIRHQAYLLSYAKSVTEQVQQSLDSTTPQMRDHIMKVFGAMEGDARSIRRLRSAESVLLGFRAKGWDASYQRLIDAAFDLAEYEPRSFAANYQRAGAGTEQATAGSLSVPDRSSLKRFVETTLLQGRTLPENWKSIKLSDLARVSGAARIGYLANEAASVIARRVLGSVRNPQSAIYPAVKALETVVTTMVTALADSIREAVRAFNPDAFTKWEKWVSVLDARTTDGCRRLNNKIFEWGKGIQPGYHWHCRSVRVPLIDDSQTSSLETFPDWLMTQSGKFRKWVKATEAFDWRALPTVDLQGLQELDQEDV